MRPLLGFALIAALLAGCTPPPPQGPPARLPSTWPVTAMRLPLGAVQGKIKQDKLFKTRSSTVIEQRDLPGTGGNERHWVSGFNVLLKWDDAVNFFSAQLTPAGFNLTRKDDPHTPKARQPNSTLYAEFENQTGKMKVILSYKRSARTPEEPAYDGYIIEAIHYISGAGVVDNKSDSESDINY